MKQILALMLAVLMLVPALAACKQNTDETETEAAISATPVKFSKSGNYTTTVSSEKIDHGEGGNIRFFSFAVIP